MADETNNKPNIFSKIGMVLSMTGAGMIDPAAPMKYAQFLKEQEDENREAQFQRAIIDKVFPGMAGKINPNDRLPTSGDLRGGVDIDQIYQNFARSNPQGVPPTEYDFTSGKLLGFNFGQTPESKVEQQIYQTVESQSQKAGELAERDFLRASGAVDTAFDQAVKFGLRQLDIFNLRPGEYFGLVDQLTPSMLNEFKDGFAGASREAAALIARQLIPGVRAANITRIFAKSAPELGKTMEASSNNAAASMGNAFVNALSQNIETINTSGQKVRIQDVTIDEKTGKPISQLPAKEKSRAINDLKRDFADQLNDDYLMRVYRIEPRLLQPRTRDKIELRLIDEELAEIDSMIGVGK